VPAADAESDVADAVRSRTRRGTITMENLEDLLWDWKITSNHNVVVLPAPEVPKPQRGAEPVAEE
jgi:hypothetical protein